MLDAKGRAGVRYMSIGGGGGRPWQGSWAAQGDVSMPRWEGGPRILDFKHALAGRMGWSTGAKSSRGENPKNLPNLANRPTAPRTCSSTSVHPSGRSPLPFHLPSLHRLPDRFLSVVPLVSCRISFELVRAHSFLRRVNSGRSISKQDPHRTSWTPANSSDLGRRQIETYSIVTTVTGIIELCRRIWASCGIPPMLP